MDSKNNDIPNLYKRSSDIDREVAILSERTRNIELNAIRIELDTKSHVKTAAYNLEQRIKKVEDNHRWGILTVLGLLLKAIFDYLQNGG